MARQRSVPKRRPAKAKALKEQQQVVAYQFKITLPGTQPLVWRRFQVPECNLVALHDAIQMVMGWENAHLHQFIINKKYYSLRTPESASWDDDLGVLDEGDLLLRDVIPAQARVFRFEYEYDFGDSWIHELTLEKRLGAPDAPPTAVCLEGANACPPEDVGGIWGYEEMKAAIQDEEHDDHEHFTDLGMDDFDPTAFSMENVNKRLKKYWMK